MKKTLAAVAVLGAFAGSAFAADVTMYGRIDAGLLYQRVDADVAHQSAENSWGLESGNMTGSRFGIRGSEQISDGLTVGFTLENGFKSDTGNFGTSGKLFDRESRLYVATDFGELGVGRMGRILSDAGSYGQRGQFIIGSSWGGMTGGTEVITDATDSRLDNMVTYKSPEFAGVTVLAQYGMGSTEDADEDDADSWDQEENTATTDRYYGVAAVGKWGALTGMLGFEQTNYASNDGTDSWDEDDSIGVEASVAYDFGIVKTALTGRYFKDGAGYNTISSTYQIERVDGYGVKLAAVAPVLGGTLQGMVGYMDAESSNTKVEDLEVSRYTVALTYEYPLSKRTKLYTAASYTKDDFKNHDEDTKAEPTNTAFMFGMAHYF